MVNYLSKFVNNLASEARILHELERKDTTWLWT